MDIATKIISNMPSNLNDLEKARYLYLELGKILSFSTQFNNTDDETVYNMFTKKVDVHNLIDNQVNCRMWSQLYSQLLDVVGIKNEVISEGHQYIEFSVNDRKWIADATYGTYTDLSRIKNDDETVGFGHCFFQNSDKHVNVVVVNEKVTNILKQVDQKLGYNTDRKQNLLEFKDYLDNIKKGNIDIASLAQVGEITKENEICFKLEYLFSTVGKLKSGYYEQKDFIYHLESILLKDEEKTKVGAVELKKTNHDKTVDIVQCIYAYCGDEIKYYLLAPNMEVQKCSCEQITKLAMMGYGIDDKKIPGIIYPRKFHKGKVSSDYKYRLYKTFCNMNLIVPDSIFIELEETYKTR